MIDKIKKGYHRVTEIIGEIEPDLEIERIKQMYPDILENAANRGKLLHLIAGKIFKGEAITAEMQFDLGMFDGDGQAWIKNMRDFATMYGKKLEIEAKRFYREEGKVTGEIDFIFEGDILVDLKTGAITSTVKAQLGGYIWLVGRPLKPYILHAPWKGKPKLIPAHLSECERPWKVILKKHLRRMEK